METWSYIKEWRALGLVNVLVNIKYFPKVNLILKITDNLKQKDSTLLTCS